MPNKITILVFLGGTALSAYGWWCLFRTESAMEFGRPLIGRETINRSMTIVHGIIGILVGPFLLIAAISNLLGFHWAQW